MRVKRFNHKMASVLTGIIIGIFLLCFGLASLIALYPIVFAPLVVVLLLGLTYFLGGIS